MQRPLCAPLLRSLLVGLAMFAPLVALSAEYRVAAGVIEDPTWGQSGSVRGIGFRIYDLLAKSASVAIDAESIPMQRLTRALESGGIDFALLPRSADFDAQSDRLCKIGTVDFSLAVLKEEREINSTRDLIGREFVRLRGGQHIDSHPSLKGLIPFPVSSMHQGFQMLALRRVAAVMCVTPGCQHAIESAGMQSEQFKFIPIESFEINLYATRRPRLPEGFSSIKNQLTKYCSSREAQQKFADIMASLDVSHE